MHESVVCQEIMEIAIAAAKDNDGKVIGTATIEDVPFDRNRTSDYTGYLFGKDNTVDVTLDDTWEESYTDKW